MRGVCIVALGYRIYGEMAFNLAASLRVVSPDIQIALLYDHDGISTLKDEHLKLFNQHIEVGGEEITVSDSKHYQIAKLLVYKYSPFDFTIYIDADTLWGLKPIEQLFDQYRDLDFMVGAHSVYDKDKDLHSIMGYTYWCRASEACVYHNLPWIQQTISGLFYFRKSEIAEKIFTMAKEVYHDPGTPNFTWANGKPDEYCFNVALAKMGIEIPRNYPIYFDKVCTQLDEQQIFNHHYGVAIGGHKITHQLKSIYGTRSQVAAQKLGLNAFPAVEKYIAIPARSNENNAVAV